MGIVLCFILGMLVGAGLVVFMPRIPFYYTIYADVEGMEWINPIINAFLYDKSILIEEVMGGLFLTKQDGNQYKAVPSIVRLSKKVIILKNRSSDDMYPWIDQLYTLVQRVESAGFVVANKGGY